ncbi:MAG TPA: dihydrolipoyl dehydrogenase [Desulfomonilia bacterium]|nr:dihydrolipoyl dehydrogenase [Desulfomonilia bacterium]
MPKPYDLFVIGGGPGGYTAALLGARKGLRVGIAEASQMGGVCTNRGCIPSKTYIESINLYNRMKIARRFGIDAGTATLTLESLHARKAKVVTRLVKGIEHLLEQAGVDTYRGCARLEPDKTLTVGEEHIASSSIIIATGARPKKPTLFDIEGVLTSDDIFDLKALPSSLVIVGGGVIGLEMAHVFSNLGTEVTVIEALDRVLSTEDEEVSEQLVKQYRKVRFITKARVSTIETASGYKLTVESPGGTDTVTGEGLLLCIGREPVIPEGLQSLGIAFTASGGIDVDPSMHTNLEGIYAIGDVKGFQMYAYVASKEAGVAVDTITGGSQTMDYSAIPSVVFTDPEIASVGKRIDPEYHTAMIKGTFPVSALGRARIMEASDGFANVYCSPEGKMERVTIMAPHATELISWATLAIEQGLHVEEFLKPHYPHPALSELLKEAAEDCLGLCINKP